MCIWILWKRDECLPGVSIARIRDVGIVMGWNKTGRIEFTFIINIIGRAMGEWMDRNGGKLAGVVCLAGWITDIVDLLKFDIERAVYEVA